MFVVPLAGLAFVALLLQRPTDAMVERWADAYGLELTPGNRPMVTWYLVNARRLRRCGAIAGLLLPAPVAAALGGRASSGSMLWALVGYLVGALWAEVALGRPLPAGPAQASLLTRRLSDYSPPWLRWAQRGVGLSAVLLSVLVAVLDARPLPAELDLYPSAAAALGSGLVALVVAITTEVAQRWLVARRQPVVSRDLLAADDAIRSQSVISIGGAGLAILLLLMGPLLWSLNFCDVSFLRHIAPIPAILCLIGSLVVWARLGHWRWRVERPGAATLAGART